MKKLSSFLFERAPDAQVGRPMIASGETGQRHAKKYLSNPDTATYVSNKKIEHIPKGEKLTVHGTRHDPETNTTYATVSHHSDPNKKVETPISSINKPMERRSGWGGRSDEEQTISHLHNQITSSKEPVYMHDRNGVKHRIVGAVQVKGNPKADMALVNDKGEHVIHVSLKKSEESNQGYGAFNKQSTANHPAIKDFGERLTKREGEGASLQGRSRTMPLSHSNPEHHDLIKRALFGERHNDAKSGIDNVDEIHHGKVNLSRNSNGTYGLTSEKRVTRKNYHSDKYELVAKNAPDRYIPNTKIKGILGVWAAGKRKGKDVKSVAEEIIVRSANA